jgi:RNA polymerase sigma factor (sigma-70 family)
MSSLLPLASGPKGAKDRRRNVRARDILSGAVTAEQAAAAIRLEYDRANRAEARGNAGRAAERRRRAIDLFDAAWLAVMEPTAVAVARRFARLGRRAGLELTDLLQEAYLKSRAAIAHFVPGRGTSFHAWLWTVLGRLFIDMLRMHRPAAPLPGDDFLEAPGEDPAEDPQGLRAQVQRLVARALPDDPRRRHKVIAFLLYYHQDWTMQQLARRLGVSVSTVFRWLGEVREVVAGGLREPAACPPYREAGARALAGAAPSTQASGSAKQQ